MHHPAFLPADYAAKATGADISGNTAVSIAMAASRFKVPAPSVIAPCAPATGYEIIK
jgi:hypothetical protein